jgi:hypothetical protein
VNEQARADAEEALRLARMQQGRLEQAGFELDEFGQYRAEGATAVVYPSSVQAGDEVVPGYEVDITLPSGSMGFDIARRDLHLTIGPAPSPPAADGEQRRQREIEDGVVPLDEWLHDHPGPLFGGPEDQPRR